MEREQIRIGITQGDINGVGYEVILKTLADEEVYENFTPVIYGSSKGAAYHRKALNIQNMSLNSIRTVDEAHPNRINIVSCGDDNARVELGKSTPMGGEAALAALRTAVDDLKRGAIDVLVTAPINKKNIQSDNFHFPGHTEFLQQAAGGRKALMLLVADKLRVGVVVGHVPIARVPQMITEEAILEKLRILNSSLRNDFSITRPRIAVLGLNPHAGDEGLLGSEEEMVIAPAIAKANAEGILALGPYAADGIFGSPALYKFDAILAMYHDQGLAPFKALSFTNGVNYTAGLPFVRTSPDHGTAFDIAGQNCASHESFRSALYLAIDVYRNRRINAEASANPLQKMTRNEQERNA